MGPDLFGFQPFVYHRVERVELPCSLAELATGLRGERYVFLLDSAAEDPRLGRYSFVAVRPRFVLRIRRICRRNGLVRVEVPDEWQRTTEFRVADPFRVVRRALQGPRGAVFTSEAGAADTLPFVGGLVGYIGYEMLHFVEAVAEGPVPDLGLPDLLLAGVDQVVAVCHRTGAAFLSVLGRGPHAAAARANARELIARLRALVWSGARAAPAALDPGSVGGLGEEDWSASLSEGDYLRAIAEIKERIAAGDLYQMNLTRRLSRRFDGSAEELYRVLRSCNPAPFGAYYRMPEADVLSCSPERFLRMDGEGWVRTRPMKGTRPRGGNPGEDRCLAAELSASVKDQAEHVMIVDLLRNDLGRVCRFGSVRVPEVMTIERYATVLQMVSTVVGRLRAGLDAVDLLRATFPGGSMTGAPKVAAMQLISRLEPVARGIYSGCLGYLDVRGGCDLNIAIRTAVVRHGWIHVQSGGAIVADSCPDAEFEEACLKARALTRAVEVLCRQIQISAPVPVA